MKIAKTNVGGEDCFIVMTEKLPDKKKKTEIETQLQKKYGSIITYFISSKPEEKDLWITGKHGLFVGAHDVFKKIDFDFVLFKDPHFFL